MTQFQFETICEILKSGAPALANELINSLDALVKEYLKLKQIVEESKKKDEIQQVDD